MDNEETNMKYQSEDDIFSLTLTFIVAQSIFLYLKEFKSLQLHKASDAFLSHEVVFIQKYEIFIWNPCTFLLFLKCLCEEAVLPPGGHKRVE